MKRIAILTCLKSNQVCTGASCLATLNGRRKSFARYSGEEVELMAFWHCNGCACDYEKDAGLAEKLERIQKIGVDTVHLGICTDKRDNGECPQITWIAAMLERAGIEVVRGTH